jgi:hypothetical protein
MNFSLMVMLAKNRENDVSCLVTLYFHDMEFSIFVFFTRLSSLA